MCQPLLPRFELASSFSRDEPDTLSLAASDSLDKDEQDYYTHLDEASSHSQSQCSHSDNGSSLKGTAASVVFSLQDTLKMVFAKLNLDPFLTILHRCCLMLPCRSWVQLLSLLGKILGLLHKLGGRFG